MLTKLIYSFSLPSQGHPSQYSNCFLFLTRATIFSSFPLLWNPFVVRNPALTFAPCLPTAETIFHQLIHTWNIEPEKRRLLTQHKSNKIQRESQNVGAQLPSFCFAFDAFFHLPFGHVALKHIHANMAMLYLLLKRSPRRYCFISGLFFRCPSPSLISGLSLNEDDNLQFTHGLWITCPSCETFPLSDFFSIAPVNSIIMY